MNSSCNDGPSAVVRPFPTAPNRGHLTLREVADAYMVAYTGRDLSIESRHLFWVNRFGDVRIVDLHSDAIADAPEELVRERVRKYTRRDAEGQRIFRPAGQRGPATVNHYRQPLSAVMTGAQRMRLPPKGSTHGRNVDAPSPQETPEPCVVCVRLALGSQHRGACPVDQQCAKVSIPTLAHTQQLRLAAADVLARH